MSKTLNEARLPRLSDKLDALVEEVSVKPPKKVEKKTKRSKAKKK